MIQRATTWVSNSSMFPKQISQNCQLPPFPYSPHWSRRAVLPPALSWAHLDWVQDACMQSCRQKSDRTEEIGTIFHATVRNLWSKRTKKICKYKIQFLLIIFFSYSPATIFSFRYVSLAALCTWSNSPAYFWSRFSLGFTRGKKDWYKKERGIERKLRNTKLLHTQKVIWTSKQGQKI